MICRHGEMLNNVLKSREELLEFACLHFMHDLWLISLNVSSEIIAKILQST